MSDQTEKSHSGLQPASGSKAFESGDGQNGFANGGMPVAVRQSPRYNVGAAVPANLPDYLTSRDRWVLWRLEQVDDEPKPRKVPYYADGGRRRGAQGTPADLAGLASFEKVAESYREGSFSGIGFAPLPGDDVVALDFDHCIKNGVIDSRIAALIDGTYAEVSPSGTGIRAFMAGALRSKKDIADPSDKNSDGSRKDGLFDVEFFGHNGFVTVTGSVTADCEMFGLENTVAPVSDAVTALYVQRFGNDGALVVRNSDPFSSEDADLTDLPSATRGWTLDEAREILFACDANCSRQQWLNALMALHHEMDGAPEALDLADEWSATASNYGGRADVEGRWRSFGKRSGQHISGAFLIKWRNESVAHLKYDAVSEWKTKLQQASDEFSLREKLCPEIAKDYRLDDMGRETLAQALKDAFARLGTKYSIAQCRPLVIEKRLGKNGEQEGRPAWLDGWVWVTDADKFFRMDSEEWLSIISFNHKFDRFMRKNESGGIVQSAAQAATREYLLPTVTRSLYVPWADMRFKWEGIDCVNTYRPSSVPEAVASLSAEGRGAIEIVMRHLRMLAGQRAEVMTTLLDWIAHQVQRPGVKVRWAPVIKGVEGDGKTVLSGLLAAVMGRVNVRNVSPKVLESPFTGWAEGAAVVVLEEIKLTGHNRHDIMNALKPFITNDSIEVHPKNKNAHEAMNTANYLGFTNFGDALPINDTDRRWFVLFTPWDTIEALETIVTAAVRGVSLAAYFESLFDAIQQQASELRRWLLDYTISGDFKPNGRAPMTEEKTVMIGLSVSEDEATAREILEKGGEGITGDLFLSGLFNAAMMASGGPVLQTSALSSLLKRMGYTRQKKLRWRGRVDTPWALGHRHWEHDEMKKHLDAALPAGLSVDDEISGTDLF